MRVFVIMATLTWATACKTIDPYVASGEVIHDITREVVETGAVIFRECNNHTLTATQCDNWVKFVEKFKVSRAIAIKTWRFAVAHNDDIEKGKAIDIMMALSAELGEFTELVLSLGRGGPV